MSSSGEQALPRVGEVLPDVVPDFSDQRLEELEAELERVLSPEGEKPGKGFVVWLTGLSGAGKTTIAEALAVDLEVRGHLVEMLDGDAVRTHLSAGLGFSKEDRDTNVARVGWVASRVARAGACVVVSLVSPYPEARAKARGFTENVGVCFFEVHVSTPLATCIERDTKGLYAKAIAGEIENFTGVSDPYIEPERPDLRIDTTDEDIAASVKQILDLLAEHRCLHTF